MRNNGLVLRTLGLATLKTTLDCQSCKTWSTSPIQRNSSLKFKKGDKAMSLKTALFLSVKIIALTVVLFICWSFAGSVVGL
jgi:hypothetical protein